MGKPVLRQVARWLSPEEIYSPEVRELIRDMRHTVKIKKYGVGLAAPQVGKSIALSVISIKPTKSRPRLEPFERVIINPEVLETYGRRTGMWEGCISYGSG